jgi:hypothetical protein
VTFHDPAVAHQIGEEMPLRPQKFTLNAVDVPHQTGGKREARIEQDAPVVGDAVLPTSEESSWRDEDPPGMRIETRERSGQPVQLAPVEPPVANEVVQHLTFVETPHQHQPVDRPARPPYGQSVERHR